MSGAAFGLYCPSPALVMHQGVQQMQCHTPNPGTFCIFPFSICICLWLCQGYPRGSYVTLSQVCPLVAALLNGLAPLGTLGTLTLGGDTQELTLTHPPPCACCLHQPSWAGLSEAGTCVKSRQSLGPPLDFSHIWDP